jgi:hypothetical protein
MAGPLLTRRQPDYEPPPSAAPAAQLALGGEIPAQPVGVLLEAGNQKEDGPVRPQPWWRIGYRNYYWFTPGDSAHDIIQELRAEGVTGITIRKAEQPNGNTSIRPTIFTLHRRASRGLRPGQGRYVERRYRLGERD